MHPSMARRSLAVRLAVFSLLTLLASPALGQSTGGMILGRVADPSGAVLSNVSVRITNQATGVARETKTNGSGDYTFVEVAPGNYTAEFEQKGFKRNVQKDVTVDVNQAVTLNSTLQIGATAETVEVTSEAPLVDITSTQLGAVVNDRSVSQLPLNARDTYQFLQLQPGVVSTVGSGNQIVYGSDKAGSVSVNGGRGRANNFSVNGGDANDQFVNLPTVQPSPDSIEEFRVLTNTFDAEYGRNSGSVVNVITKSGTNALHGNLYEFFRNTKLNANPYCLPAVDGVPCDKPQSNQNQFGGTLGGPIKKDRTFFFTSYEGRRVRQGIRSQLVFVPTALQRPDPNNPKVNDGQSGIVADFSDSAPFPGALGDTYPLTLLPNCAAAIQGLSGITLPAAHTSSVNYAGTYNNAGHLLSPGIFTDVATGKDNMIPLECMDPTAVDLMLKYVPLPANGGGKLVTTALQPQRGDQFTVRLDHRLNNQQNLSIYYYFNDDHSISPFAVFEAAGANVPGFGSIVNERFQQWNISHTWTLSNTTVNEFRFNYNREAQRTFQHPVNTSLIQDSCPPAPSWLTNALGSVPCFNDLTQGNPTGIHPNLG